jgi:hypothetical protein
MDTTKKTILGVLLLTLSLLCLCVGNKTNAQNGEEADCYYQAINGTCAILSIDGDSALSPVTVKHTFTPTDDVDLVLDEDNTFKSGLTSTSSSYSESSKDLNLACLKDVGIPKKEDLETKCNIKENMIVPCTVHVPDAGTCKQLFFYFRAA